MELESRPMLLSPALPRLPGGLAAPTAPPPLEAAEFAPRPPPIPCDPLPEAVQQRLEAGEGWALALEGHRKHSQLAWALQERQVEEQRRREAAAAALAELEALQAERPARASRPAALAPGAASAIGSSSASGSEGAVCSADLHQHSRASAVLQEQQPEEPEEQEPGSDAELAALLEHELAGGHEAAPMEADEPQEEPAAAAEAATAAAMAAPVAAAAAIAAAAAAEAAAAEAAAAEPAPEPAAKPLPAAVRRQQRQSARRQPAPKAADTAAPAAPAAQQRQQQLQQPPPQQQQTQQQQEQQQQEQQQQRQQLEAAAKAAEALLVAAGAHLASGAESSSSDDEEDGGEQLGQQRPRRKTLAEQAVATALEKIGEASWEEFCAKLRAQAAAAAERGGGGRGRGRGRKGGRGAKRKAPGEGGGSEEVLLSNVCNKNSPHYHEAFAAAYAQAKALLDKTDAKKQRAEALRQHSALVKRWSDLTESEHAWYLRHEGLALVGGEAERFAQLRARVEDERRHFWQSTDEATKSAKSAARYSHCTERQLAQLEGDAAGRRAAVHTRLPRHWRLREVLRVQPAQPGEAPALQHLGTLRRQGAPPVFAPPPPGTAIPSSKVYLPASVEGSAAGGAVGGSGGSSDVFRKYAAPAIAEDPLLLQLAGEQAAPAAASSSGEAQPLYCLAAAAVEAIVSTPMLDCHPGWEIPVTVVPSAAASADGAGSGSGRLVCLEKPLLPRVMSMRAKQQRLQKYALLSLGVQQPASQQQQRQQPQQPQQQRPQRRRTRGSSAAAADDEDAAASVPAAPAAASGPAVPPREAAYDSWQLGGCRLLVRSHGRLLLQPATPQDAEQQQQQQQERESQGEAEPAPPPPPQQQHVLLALKTQYLPEPDVETFTLEELYPWWLKLLLRPAADGVLVAHAHVPHSRAASTELLTAADVERECGGDAALVRGLAGGGLAVLAALLETLGQQEPGRYLLSHTPQEGTCLLFRALPPELAATVEGDVPPLPCSASAAQPQAVYDLHLAHQRSGATDTRPEVGGPLPARWRCFHPAIPQIPYTFPPRLTLAKMGRKHAAKQRRKGHVPYAWGVLGRGGDFDQVHHVAQISRADYLAGLEDELE